MFTEKDIEQVIEIYETRGIVTRDDFGNMDSRPLSEEVYDEMQRRGYDNVMMTEAHLSGYADYSRAIYNADKYTFKEADEYLIKNVLHEWKL